MKKGVILGLLLILVAGVSEGAKLNFTGGWLGADWPGQGWVLVYGEAGQAGNFNQGESIKLNLNLQSGPNINGVYVLHGSVPSGDDLLMVFTSEFGSGGSSGVGGGIFSGFDIVLDGLLDVNPFVAAFMVLVGAIGGIWGYKKVVKLTNRS